MNWVQRTIIVPIALVPLAQALSAGIAGQAGAGMYITGLASTSAGPATYGVSSGCIEEQYAGLLTDANAMYAACQAAGAPVTLAQCQALVSQSDVSDLDIENPWSAFARLGLVLVQEPM